MEKLLAPLDIRAKSDTIIATKYVDILGDLSKVVIAVSFFLVIRFTGMFEIAVHFVSWTMVMSNVALKAGSSKQGKARRAPIGSNCVAINNLNGTIVCTS